LCAALGQFATQDIAFDRAEVDVQRTRDLAIVPACGVVGKHIPKALVAVSQWQFITRWGDGLWSCLDDSRDDNWHLDLYTGLLLPLLGGGSQCRRMLFEQPLQRVAQITKEMEAIRYLNGLWRTAARSFGKIASAIAADEGDGWVLLQPGGERLGFGIRKHINRLMAFEIDNQGAIGAAFTNGPIIYPDDLRFRW
jgi:hypothetical protein